jgi:hypothetical protein
MLKNPDANNTILDAVFVTIFLIINFPYGRTVLTSCYFMFNLGKNNYKKMVTETNNSNRQNSKKMIQKYISK